MSCAPFFTGCLGEDKKAPKGRQARLQRGCAACLHAGTASPWCHSPLTVARAMHSSSLQTRLPARQGRIAGAANTLRTRRLVKIRLSLKRGASGASEGEAGGGRPPWAREGPSEMTPRAALSTPSLLTEERVDALGRPVRRIGAGSGTSRRAARRSGRPRFVEVAHVVGPASAAVQKR